MDRINRFLHNRHLWAVAPLLAIVCFVNTVEYGYVYDDYHHIVNAVAALEDWSAQNFKILFTKDIWTFLTRKINTEGVYSSFYYRPLLGFYWMVNYALAGTTPWKWHLSAIILHTIASVLVYLTIEATLKHTEAADESRFLALVAAVIFAVHPAQSESVAWIAAYASALITIQILLSLMVYLKVRQRQRNARPYFFYLLFSAFLFCLALLTKESAMLLLLLLFCYEVFLLDRSERWYRRLYYPALNSIPFILVVLSYVYVRLKVFGVLTMKAGVLNPDYPEVDIISRSVQIYTLPTVILTYLKNTVLPFALTPFYPIYHIHSPGWGNFILPTTVLVLLAVVVVVVSWKSLTARVGFIWFVAPLIPALEIRALKVESLIHDRYLYVSLIGAGLLLGHALIATNQWLNRREGSKEAIRPSLLLGLVFIVVVLIVTTVKQNTIWADDASYWNAAAQGAPDSCLANREMGRISYQDNKREEALFYTEKAKKACPYSPNVAHQLATIYAWMGNYDKAEAEFKWLVELPPYPANAAKGFYNLGLLYHTKGDIQKAIEFYKRSIEFNLISAYTAEAHHQLGVIYSELGELLQAEAHFRKSLELPCYDFTAAANYYNLGLIFKARSDNLHAKEYFQKAIERAPDSEAAKAALKETKQ